MADDVWFYITLVLGTVVIALIILLIMQREKKKPLSEEPAKPPRSEIREMWPLATSRTISEDVVRDAKDKLRILDLEREILSYAIRRLYEARAEGKITEEERDSLALKYKDDLNRIKEEISRGESVIALGELERMQQEFVDLFSERFEALSKRIEELRAISGFPPPKIEPLETAEPLEEEEGEEKVAAPTQPAEKAIPPKRKREVAKPKAPSEEAKTEKSEAEKKAEQILAEVEKVLEKLGQMEVEE